MWEQDSRYAEYWNRCRNGFAAGEVPFCPRIFGHCVGKRRRPGGCKKRGKYIFLRRKDQGAGEKNEVKARVIAYALRELIDQASDVMIMGHENCDIDCLGAALGIYRVAKNRNKEAHI